MSAAGSVHPETGVEVHAEHEPQVSAVVIAPTVICLFANDQLSVTGVHDQSPVAVP